jgi:RNA ligase (TIGR02306 family)
MWFAGQLAVYLEPDTMAEGTRAEFAFLNGEKPPRLHRIKAKRLRGIWSEGLLVPAPEGLVEGDDAWELLGLSRYVPPETQHRGPKSNIDSIFGSAGDWDSCTINPPEYGLENFKKFGKLLTEGEEIIISEKIHGQNFKAGFLDGELKVGSMKGWRKTAQTKTIDTPEGPKTYVQSQNNWWAAVDQNPWIRTLCEENPNKVFYGEIYGQVQDLKYGAKQNQIFLKLFDVWDVERNRYLQPSELEKFNEEYFAPVLYRGPFSKEIVLSHTDGPSVLPGANHIREGAVIKSVGSYRRILKSVSNFYLERS